MCNVSCKNIAQCDSTSVTYLTTAENVARQVAETIAKCRTRFYFLQRFQATFGFVAQSHEPVAKCERLCNVSCNLSGNALQDKLQDKLQEKIA